MNLTVWTSFTKKRKSTAQPASTGIVITALLKQDTTVKNPHFILHTDTAASVKYAYVQGWGLYYFVDDCTYLTGDQWDLSLYVDALASFKTDIGNYYGKILRCSDLTFYNPMLRDELNPPTEDIILPQIRTHSISNLFVDQCYVLTLAASADSYSSSDTLNGFCRAYVLTPQQMVQVAKRFLDTNFLQQLSNSFTNPMDCVVSCKFLPVTKSLIEGDSPTQENIEVGGEPLNASANIVKNRFVTVADSLDLPLKPHGSNSYLDAEPYTTLSVFLPFVGVVPLDLGVVRSTWKLNFSVSIDVLTGDVMYKFYSDTARTQLCATYSGNCGSDCPVSSSTWNTKSYLGGALTTIGGAAVAIASMATGGAAGAVIGGLGAIAGGIGTMSKAAEIHTQINGSISSALGIYASTSIIAEMLYKNPAHAPTSNASVTGLPCNKYGKVSEHAGFLLMQEASVPLSTYDGLRETVNEAMNSGFYYE